jgi:hypothetical protein
MNPGCISAFYGSFRVIDSRGRVLRASEKIDATDTHKDGSTPCFALLPESSGNLLQRGIVWQIGDLHSHLMSP